MPNYKEKETSWHFGLSRRTKTRTAGPSFAESLRHFFFGSKEPKVRSLKPRKKRDNWNRDYNW